MNNEIISTGKTVEEAIQNGCKKLKKQDFECDIEVLEEAKKGFLGLGRTDAKVKLTIKSPNETEFEQFAEEVNLKDTEKENEKSEIAVKYLTDILNKMNIEDYSIKTVISQKGIKLVIDGKNLGILIGRHGETLDALQYLVSLVCNKIDSDYCRITLDCGNYRANREETLKELSRKLSEKAKRTGRVQILEPMNPYERRLIHAVVSNIEGVSSKSKGEEPYRKVIIIPNDKHYNYNKRIVSNKTNKEVDENL